MTSGSRITSGIRAALLAAALVGLPATSADVPANAMPGFAADDPDPTLPTGPNDPRCIGMPGLAQCQGGPFAQPAAPAGPKVPTSPFDPTCATMPADGACAGGPYAIPSAPAQPVPAAPSPAVPAPAMPSPALPAPAVPEPVVPAMPAMPAPDSTGGMPGHI
ncbi:hypothetical protein [Mycobacterium vicinigordonae]|uniref:Intersectin-EH binding protein Ibp1 n=1 Tax=Mycobacterium vicinigordonae TaxID=1719132 RepID=A0A7D6HXL2_9MYCO|nr:hypothetical protein [Mycobacterium vicinigordonae]QLL09433.1 hypothetical protein H0P51_11490 [Mycobacterium vicinigordonae]